MPSVDEESSPLTRLYEAVCPKVGAPLTDPIVLTLVKDMDTFNPKVIQELLTTAVLKETKNISIQKVSIVRVDLPFKPDSYASFVVVKKSMSEIPEAGSEGLESKKVLYDCYLFMDAECFFICFLN